MSQRGKISLSLVCADIFSLQEMVETAQQGNIDYFHIDVMDGRYVPNYALSPEFCRQLREQCEIAFDYHLMVEDASDKIAWFPLRKGDQVSVHAVCEASFQRAVEKIRAAGADVLLAVAPDDDISRLQPYLKQVDGVLALTVQPGFYGQRMILNAQQRVEDIVTAAKLSCCRDPRLFVDGHITFDNAQTFRKLGVEGFVAGSSCLLRDRCLRPEDIERLRERIL